MHLESSERKLSDEPGGCAVPGLVKSELGELLSAAPVAEAGPAAQRFGSPAICVRAYA